MEHPGKDIYHHGEIDLLELFRVFGQQKWLILLVTMMSTLIGLAYIFCVKPIYEVQIHLRAPSAIEVERLNYSQLVSSKPLQLFDVKIVYDLFISILLAESTKHEFFHTIYLPSLPGAHYKQFKNLLTIKEISKVAPAEYIISMQGQSADKLPQWVNQYLNFANKQATDQIFHAIKQQQQNTLVNLKQEIDIAREQAKKNRFHRLAQLKEALKIAEAAGLSDASQVVAGGFIVQNPKFNEPSLMYSRGTKALTAEINNLNNRESDEFFTSKLLQLQSRYNLYKQAQINLGGFKAFYGSGVMKSDGPVAPRKAMILATSIILGLIGGILIGLLRNFFRMNPSVRL